MSIKFTIHIVTLSYKFMSSSCYREIHLLRFIFCHCTLIYNKYVISLCFIISHHKNLLISQISNKYFCYILNTMFFWRQVHLQPPQILDSRHIETIERRILIGGLSDCCEEDCESDLNRLASVIHRQYTTVTN